MGWKRWLARALEQAAGWLKKSPAEEPEPREKVGEEGRGGEKRGEGDGDGVEIRRLWDLLTLHEHTQAYHLVKVVGFEEWVDMEEILRRIEECFGARYKNTRSLYPYIKTLVDLGFFEATSIGGRRKWRKKELLLAVLLKAADAKKKKKKAVLGL